MSKIRYSLWYTKLNLLWLFKYRCKIPCRVWFSFESIEQGSILAVYDERLHIVKVANTAERDLLFGIALEATDAYDSVRILKRGTLSGVVPAIGYGDGIYYCSSTLPGVETAIDKADGIYYGAANNER